MSDSWDFDRGEDLPRHELFRVFIASEVQECLEQYLLHGNGIFVWRAWRIARANPEWEIPPEFQKKFARYFDDCARGLMKAETNTGIAQALRLSTPKGSRGEGKQAAQGQTQAYWTLDRFIDLLAQEEAIAKEGAKRRAEDRLGLELGINYKAVQARIRRARESRAKNRTLLLERE